VRQNPAAEGVRHALPHGRSITGVIE